MRFLLPTAIISSGTLASDRRYLIRRKGAWGSTTVSSPFIASGSVPQCCLESPPKSTDRPLISSRGQIRAGLIEGECSAIDHSDYVPGLYPGPLLRPQGS